MNTTTSPASATTPPTAVLVVNRLAPLHSDRCASTDDDATYRLPPGTRVLVIETSVDYCTRVRVTVPTEGEITGLVAAARLSKSSARAEPEILDWANANPKLAAKSEVAAVKNDHAKQGADTEDLKRWAHERMTAFCPDPNLNMGSVVSTTGDDKMRAALAFAACTDEQQRQRALGYLDEIAAQCFQTDEWKKDCPRRTSVDDERRRVAQPNKP